MSKVTIEHMDMVFMYMNAIEKIYDLDITLEVEYSTHRGYVIKLKKKGNDMPVVEVFRNDKKEACRTAIEKMQDWVIEQIKEGKVDEEKIRS